MLIPSVNSINFSVSGDILSVLICMLCPCGTLSRIQSEYWMSSPSIEIFTSFQSSSSLFVSSQKLNDGTWLCIIAKLMHGKYYKWIVPLKILGSLSLLSILIGSYVAHLTMCLLAAVA